MSGPTTPYGHSIGHAVSGGMGLGRPVGPSVPYIYRESDSAFPESHMMYHVGVVSSSLALLATDFWPPF